MVGLSHFQCYEVRPPNTFNRTNISLSDAYGDLNVDLNEASTVCAPVNKNGEDPGAPDAVWHLASYLLGVNGAPFERVKGVSITNQFGTLTLNLIKPGRLFVPSLKNGTPAVPGMPSHFTCYSVDRTLGTAAFTPVKGVTIATQFESAVIDVISPLRLCVPTDKNDEGIPDPVDYLMCYETRGTGSFRPLKITIDNQFGPQSWTVSQRRELCVPSTLTDGAARAVRQSAASFSAPRLGMAR